MRATNITYPQTRRGFEPFIAKLFDIERLVEKATAYIMDIGNAEELKEAIAALKKEKAQKETALRRRFNGPGAVLRTAWSLRPWAKNKFKTQPSLPAEVATEKETGSYPTPPMAFKDYFTKQAVKNGFTILKAAFSGFSDDMAMKYSASLAYYTIFSLAPLLLLLISVAGIVLGKDAIQGKVFHELNGLVGNDAAKQIQDMLQGLQKSGQSTISVIIGAVTLVLGATTVFGEIQESINIIWQVKPKPKVGWIKLLKNRLLSGSLIIAIGFLLLVSLVVNGALLAASDYLQRFLPDVTVTFFGILSALISFVVIAVLFGVIFKVLPDAKVRWKDVRSGAIFTAVLFMIGRIVIGIYIEKSGTSSTYGAAGSLIVILLWVYYTAAILYFVAEFTRAYADFYGVRIEPAQFAVHVEQTEAEQDVAVVPPKHNA